jgi:hypothetical protein
MMTRVSKLRALRNLLWTMALVLGLGALVFALADIRGNVSPIEALASLTAVLLLIAFRIKLPPSRRERLREAERDPFAEGPSPPIIIPPVF